MSGGDGDTVETIRPCYGLPRPRWCHPLTDPVVVVAATVVALGAWSASWAVAAVLGVAGAALVRACDLSATRWMLVVVVAVAALAGLRGEREAAGLEPRALGAFDGWAHVVGEPRPYDGATRAVVAIEGQRFEIWARGDLEAQVAARRGGDLVHVRGERVPLRAERARRVAWQHVVGQLRLDAVGEALPGSRVARASNAVRSAIERGAAELDPPDDALFRGLVIGDRRGQPAEMVERFRASGLAHLTVVSGLNVALLLVLVAPVVRSLRPWARWAVTVALVAWFASLTRFEPSIVRAGAMAALSATAFVLGRDRAPFRILCVAVAALVIVDPLLVHSVGFWLSVGATAGVCTAGPALAARLARLGPLAAPLGITLGAQVGVAVPLVATFGQVPLVSVPANLLAVPVAGLVKLYGLPAGMVAGWVPPLAGPLMLPCRVGVRWVDHVAHAGEQIEPGGLASWVGWGALAVVVAVLAAKNRARDDGAPAHR